ncbi:GIY-YIG nuclease family protein [Halomonas sp. SpR1]|uniref:GIY-YIG nuclease family protein n=1 Tax=Halomonas sp. SpR1 TaxID=3050462 RepID=UPI0027E52EB1|nr:GIY-YIG nuclease family protein [Halomonas sp. SpR1]MDQ7735752.1 GIY-YIG nuclease family protein [Halomonas sp. SpR1]
MNLHKKLKQQYKDTPRTMGVYRVYNQEDELSFVGVAKDIQARLNRHQAELKFGKHRNKALQADWNRLGESSFVFQIVELLSPLEDPDYDPTEDLEELLDLTLAQKEYRPSRLYNGNN